jgi:hypothetical protein
MGWSKSVYTMRTCGGSFRNQDTQAAYKEELRRNDREREQAAHDRQAGPLREAVMAQNLLEFGDPIVVKPKVVRRQKPKTK